MADLQKGLDSQLQAVAHGSSPAAVAVGDTASWHANRHGIPFVVGGHPDVVTRMGVQEDDDGIQTSTSILNVTSLFKAVITRMSVFASPTNTANVSFLIGFGLFSEPIIPPPTGRDGFILAHPDLAPGSGVITGDGSGIIGMGGNDHNLFYSSSDTTGGEIYIVFSYYMLPSD